MHGVPKSGGVTLALVVENTENEFWGLTSGIYCATMKMTKCLYDKHAD